MISAPEAVLEGSFLDEMGPREELREELRDDSRAPRVGGASAEARDDAFLDEMGPREELREELRDDSGAPRVGDASAEARDDAFLDEMGRREELREELRDATRDGGRAKADTRSTLTARAEALRPASSPASSLSSPPSPSTSSYAAWRRKPLSEATDETCDGCRKR